MVLFSRWFKNDDRLQKTLVSDPHHVMLNDSGRHVTLIQTALMEIDGVEIAADELKRNFYGPSTAEAVLNYKKRKSIINFAYQKTADDIVGKMTIKELDKDMAEREKQRSGLLLAFSIPAQPQGIIVSQSHAIPNTWASQVEDAHKPLFVKRPSPTGSPRTVVTGLKTLIRDAGKNGVMLFATGHGIIGDFPTSGGFDLADKGALRIGGLGSFRDSKTFVDVFDADPPPKGSPERFSPKETDERLKGAGSKRRLENFALYQELVATFRQHQPFVVLLTCRVGSSREFLKKVASQWQTPILAYTDFVSYEGDVTNKNPKLRERARAVFDRDTGKFKTANPGTNTVFAETHIPFSIPDMALIFPG